MGAAGISSAVEPGPGRVVFAAADAGARSDASRRSRRAPGRIDQTNRARGTTQTNGIKTEYDIFI